jgi:hypothetical protein
MATSETRLLRRNFKKTENPLKFSAELPKEY